MFDISKSKIVPFVVVLYLGWPYLPWIWAGYKLYSITPTLSETVRWYTVGKKALDYVTKK